MSRVTSVGSLGQGGDAAACCVRLSICRVRLSVRRPRRCGPLLQLCRGPLLGHTGLIGALRVLTVSSAGRGTRGWSGTQPSGFPDAAPLPFCSLLSPQSSAAFWGDPTERRSLQRVAAVAFPSTQELEAWQRAQDAAALRDHRRIGRVSPWQKPGF